MDAFYAAVEVLDNPYLKAWGEAAKDLLEKPTEITLWEMISE
jgi:quinol monooxygenase YgiN